MTEKQSLQIKSRAIGIIAVGIGCFTYPFGLFVVPLILSTYMGNSTGGKLGDKIHFDEFVTINKPFVSIFVVLMFFLVVMLLLVASLGKTELTMIHYFAPLIAFLPVIIFSEIEMYRKNGQLP